MTDLSVNSNGTFTLYVRGKKVMNGTLAQVTEYLTGENAPRARPKRERPKSRAARWTDAAAAAVAALEELKDVQSEFEDWQSNLPENLQSSALGEKLEAVVGLDIDGAIETAQEAESTDLPLGFGRD